MKTANRKGTTELEIEIMSIIHEVGVFPHIKGYQYLRDAVLLTMEDLSLLGAVTKELYPAIAKKNNSTASRVERSIRHAIALAWNQEAQETINTFIGYKVRNGKGKPSNSEFIALVTNILQRERKVS